MNSSYIIADPVSRWLDTFVCKQYADTFRKFGYEKLNDVCRLDKLQLMKMGVAQMDIDKIIENVSVLQQTLQQAGCSTSSANSSNVGSFKMAPVYSMNSSVTPLIAHHDQFMDNNNNSINVNSMNISSNNKIETTASPAVKTNRRTVRDIFLASFLICNLTFFYHYCFTSNFIERKQGRQAKATRTKCNYKSR
jgi:hypothetical protein